jgi:phage terminase large subunit GpA-like protein
MFVDSGDGTTTNDVYLWVRTQPAGQVVAIKGNTKSSLPVGPPSPVDVNKDGTKIKSGIKIRSVNVDFFKAELYASLRLRPPTAEELAQGFQYPQGYNHFPDGGLFGDEFFKQLCAEQLLSHRNRKTGRTKTEWQQTRPRNEALDVSVYARAAAWELGYDRMQEKHFLAAEAQLKIVPKKIEAPQPERTEQRRPPQRDSYLGDRGRNWF